MTSKNALSTSLAVAVATGCLVFGSSGARAGEDSAPHVSFGAAADLRLGQTVRFDRDIEVTFRSLVEETRYAPSPSCSRPGRAVIELEVNAPDREPVGVRLAIDSSSATLEEPHGLEVRLLELVPQATGDSAPGEASYRATIVLTFTPARLPLNQPFSLEHLKTAQLEGGLEVRFDSVLSDSRCPEGVECVWEGNAEVEFRVSVAGAEGESLRLNTNPRFQTSADYLEYTIELLDLHPYPVEGTKRDRPHLAVLTATRIE